MSKAKVDPWHARYVRFMETLNYALDVKVRTPDEFAEQIMPEVLLRLWGDCELH